MTRCSEMFHMIQQNAMWSCLPWEASEECKVISLKPKTWGIAKLSKFPPWNSNPFQHKPAVACADFYTCSSVPLYIDECRYIVKFPTLLDLILIAIPLLFGGKAKRFWCLTFFTVMLWTVGLSDNLIWTDHLMWYFWNLCDKWCFLKLTYLVQFKYM